jgi:hypothetical protein
MSVGRRGDAEHRLQRDCVLWFRLRHPRLALRLFAIPNGGRRDAVTGARLKAEGVVAGVADLFLAVPRGGCGGLFVEMKAAGGRLSAAQRAWSADVAAGGDYRYRVCRSLDGFRAVSEAYLAGVEEGGDEAPGL